ncbi:HAMP domain-containing sensor histidine kinase [Piscinibacter sp. XHJ-5]|uniref:sensor histidine kinase n=1 Tax=Piscinibacter sp. XHJ-5 TaxID=3037797 RepID=UPI0024535845|nr:HAMP domain-containing sensor histidine kinase [Piscinibacter sp. XHJ-5]
MSAAAAPASRGWRQKWHAARRSMRHSLKWRLVGLFLLLALATTVTFVAGVREMVRGGWQGYGRPLTSHYLDLLTAQIGTPPDVARAQALTRELPLSIRIDGPRVNWDSHPEATRRWQRWHPQWPDGELHRFHVRRLDDGHRITFALADPQTVMAPHLMGWSTLGVLLLLTLLAFALVRRLLRPLDDIREGAIRFGQGDLTHRIPLRRHDELGELAQQVNTMADELRAMLDAKRALLLAISHELRSPLTRARLNAELVDESEARAALLHDLAEMRDLVIDLLESERLASGHAALQPEASDLNRLIDETLASGFADRPVTTALASGLPTLPLDRMRMRLLLRNLLDNALRHSDAVVVRTERAGDRVMLVVRDHGPGVPPEHLAQLTQAFYRVDAARQRSTGGVGLGLYLCRLVAQAHGATMSIRNASPGLEVSLSLPL